MFHKSNLTRPPTQHYVKNNFYKCVHTKYQIYNFHLLIVTNNIPFSCISYSSHIKWCYNFNGYHYISTRSFSVFIPTITYNYYTFQWHNIWNSIFIFSTALVCFKVSFNLVKSKAVIYSYNREWTRVSF